MSGDTAAAIDHAPAVRGDRQGNRCDGQRAAGADQVVIGAGAACDGDRVDSRWAGRGGGGGQCDGLGQAGCGIAVDEPAVVGGEGGHGRAVCLRLVFRGDRQGQRGGGDGQCAVPEDQCVIGAGAAGDGDRVCADRAAGRRGGGERDRLSEAGGGVAIDEAAVAGA